MSVSVNLSFQWLRGSPHRCKACNRGTVLGRLLVINMHTTINGELVTTQTGPYCEKCITLYTINGVLEGAVEKEAKACRAPSRKTQKISQRQERSFAEAHGARTTAGSGSLHEKGDVRRRGQWRCECKTTTKGSFSIKRSILNKIYGECEHGEFPALDIQFTDDSGRVQDRWVAIPFSKFEELCPQD